MRKLFIVFCFFPINIVNTLLASLIVILLFPLWSPFDKKKSFPFFIAHHWARFMVFTYPGITYSIQGKEVIKDLQHPVVFIANHQSQIDILAILLIGFPLSFAAKASLFKIPFFGWALKLAGNLPVRRESTAGHKRLLQQVRLYLQHSLSVFFFPEGTRNTRPPRLLPFKNGAFNLAKQTNVPIVPVTLKQTGALLPRGAIFPLPGHFTVIIHPPITTTEFSVEQLIHMTQEMISHDLST